MDNSMRTTNCYKKKYCITFYDETDEEFIASFDNIRQICIHKGKEITSQNLTLISVELYRALKRDDHSTRMLDGRPMHVYLIDVEEIDEDEENTEN